MALAVKQLVRTNQEGGEVWVTDNTLQYVAVTNAGGWGTPNPDLNKSALVAYVYQIVPSGDGTTSTNIVLTPLTSAIAYSAGNANTVVQSIGFSYHTDGHYVSTLMMLPVSADGITTLAGATIVTDDYFLMTGAVYKKAAGGGNTLVTDYLEVVNASAVIKNAVHKLFFNKLSVKKELEYYRQYRDARNGNDSELSGELRTKMDDLEADLSGANWEFAAGLYTQAENIVAELLEKHEITSP